MSIGYKVVLDGLTAASKAAGRAADGVRPVDLGDTLAGVAQGLPGGASVDAARMVGEVWTSELADWVKNTDAYSAQLASAVKNYQANDDAAAADLHTAAVHAGPKAI
jgi:hypothetical protein